MKVYSGQLVMMAGMLGEAILNGVTIWFVAFTTLFIILGLWNFLIEIIDALEEERCIKTSKE